MGAQIIALAVQSQDEAQSSVDKTNAQYPILSDSDHAVAEAYGVYNRFSDSLAAASVFIINQEGRITWHRIAEFPTQRVNSQTILDNLPAAGEATRGEETSSSLNSVTTPDGEQVSESELARDTVKIVLSFEACCVTPGNA
jgi:alkyl hydroperoxide reductase subunit AhpC